MSRLAFCFIFPLALIMPLQIFSTCIVVIKAPNGTYYIAADGLQSYGNSKRKPDTTCKVFRHGKYLYCLAGYFGDDTKAIANFALDLPYNIGHKISIWSFNAKKTDSEYLASGKVFKHGEAESLTKAKCVSEIAFLYSDSGQTMIDHVYILIRKRIDGTLYFKDSLIHNSGLTILGFDDHILRLDQESLYIIKRDRGNGLQFCTDMVTYEGSKHPKEVGGPITKVQMSASGNIQFLCSCPKAKPSRK